MIGGDGTIEEFTRNGTEMEFIHEYANSNFQTILIDTEEITEFFYYYDSDTDGKLYEFRANDCPQLRSIVVYGNNRGCLTVLDAVNCPSLEVLNCASNQLGALDVSKFPQLKKLHCHNNELSNLDASLCPNLEYLSCGGNSLSVLNIAQPSNLKIINCSYNKLSSNELNNIFDKLPTINGKICIRGNLGTDTCNDKIMKDKGWKYDCEYPN